MPAISRPFSERNAIEACTFVVLLNQPCNPGEMARVTAAFDAIREELPGVQSQQQVLISFGPSQGFSPPQHLPDLIRFVAKADGTHKWRVQVTGNMIQVVCNDYTRFHEVWPKAHRYLLLALQSLDSFASAVEIGLQVIDKFNYDSGTNAENYDMSELFRRDSPYLTVHSWDCGLYWHVFQGWFEKFGDRGRILHQLNISNTELAAEGRIACVIDHRGAARLESPSGIPVRELLALREQDKSTLDAIYEKLHRQNSEIAKSLLIDEKLLAIGLKQVSR